MPEIRVAARRLKVSTALDPAPIAALRIVELTGSRTMLTIEVAGRKLRADIATKSLRKAYVTQAENGPDATILVLQGSLVGDRLEETGLSAQVKTKAPEAVRTAVQVNALATVETLTSSEVV
jgi:hypothetical protein